jgi:CubicO group peptidase (beta-lactamase class C family)
VGLFLKIGFTVAVALVLTATVTAAVAGPARPGGPQAPTVTQTSAALPAAATEAIDAAVTKVLADTGVPSASIAVVRGAATYTKAYGMAQLSPPTPAAPGMRYAIGSISKQFTAAVLALLAAEGKLSLDDPVAKFFPNVTRAGDITLRHLLSHTSGLRDFWPQDYVTPEMLEPITELELMNRWARLALDFEPGTKRQYSNTGFTVAGAIVEKAGGKPLIDQMRERIFARLGMGSVFDVDQGRLPSGDPVGYTRYALGPLRPAPKEGKGWLFAAGQLAMTAGDLAKWDVSLIDGACPVPATCRELETEVRLKNGLGTNYGLGLRLLLEGDRRVLSHGGEVSGFAAENRVYPDDGAAIVVLTNQDATSAPETIARKIAEVIFLAATPSEAEAMTRVRGILAGLQAGRIDRALFTANGNFYFTDAALADCKTSLGGLGAPGEMVQKQRGERGGLTTRVYRVAFADRALEITTRMAPDGRFEQFTISPE